MFSGVKKDKIKIQKRFGIHLREILKKQNIKQVELSRRLFMDKQQVNDILRGEHNVTIYTLTLICEALEMSLSEFFEDFE